MVCFFFLRKDLYVSSVRWWTSLGMSSHSGSGGGGGGGSCGLDTETTGITLAVNELKGRSTAKWRSEDYLYLHWKHTIDHHSMGGLLLCNGSLMKRAGKQHSILLLCSIIWSLKPVVCCQVYGHQASCTFVFVSYLLSHEVHYSIMSPLIEIPGICSISARFTHFENHHHHHRYII